MTGAAGAEEAGAVHALVLAAGAGTRFGGRKLLAAFEGRPLVAHAVAAALDAPVDGVTLVVGADGEEVAAAARAAAAGRPLAVVAAVGWRDGLAASLRAGTAAVSAEAGAALVFLGDMPRVPPEAPVALVAAWRAGAVAAAPACDGRRGHPVLLSRVLFPQIAALRGDRGAGALLDALGDRLARVATDDPGVLFDVDRPDDFA